jgi:nitrogen fixation protein FixH
MKPGMGWPIGIVAILASSMGANLVMMRIAGNDPSFAVEPDYYKKAVNHDSTMAQARANLALGWRASATITADARGIPVLRVRLVDSTGTALLGVQVNAQAMYVARANEVDSLWLPAVANGEYAAPLTRRHQGQWEVRVLALKDAHRFTAVLRVDVAATVVSTLPPLQTSR